MSAKAPLGSFLARNPFPNGWTDGLFYREKMRAIHRVAPAGLHPQACILEIGGGRSGLAKLLYPGLEVITIDIDAALAAQQPSASPRRFVCADACILPYADRSFDVVTLFDVLEHIEDDRAAVREALRVVRPGGAILVSTPNVDWRYPFFPFMRAICPPETELMREWGHVRRGYSPAELAALFGKPPERSATFVNPVTAFFHDVAFSRLARAERKVLYALAAPPTALGYFCHRPSTRGTETAFAWMQ